MASVSIHPPRTPILDEATAYAKATTPNVCKMPGPPAPFVPTPLPNIGKANLSPKGYSTSVKIEGNKVAIFGATFESIGDIASKATGGGLISCNAHGPTKFITPGSLTVKIEGKSVHLKGELMLNNCGPTGAPPNTGATLGGAMKASSKAKKVNLKCGEVGTYAELKKKKAKPVKMERDHIPSKAALLKLAQNMNKGMAGTALACVKRYVTEHGMTIAIPRKSHRGFSPTCGSKNTRAQIKADGKDSKGMKDAAKRDTKKMEAHLQGTKCEDAYKEAAKKVREHDNEKMINDAFESCGC